MPSPPQVGHVSNSFSTLRGETCLNCTFETGLSPGETAPLCCFGCFGAVSSLTSCCCFGNSSFACSFPHAALVAPPTFGFINTPRLQSHSLMRAEVSAAHTSHQSAVGRDRGGDLLKLREIRAQRDEVQKFWMALPNRSNFSNFVERLADLHQAREGRAAYSITSSARASTD
jgi:hypothetical protein